jgi:hypothetical protein
MSTRCGWEQQQQKLCRLGSGVHSACRVRGNSLCGFAAAANHNPADTNCHIYDQGFALARACSWTRPVLVVVLHALYLIVSLY